ncbi:MAG TPA: phosphoribosyltransferase [Candidatus Cybelea sp.]|nr:phosphoribosyltransferase [Candidatus Cybelea sp.]
MRISTRRERKRNHRRRRRRTGVIFKDRADAGRQLAEALAAYADRPDALVLALPRGGVPVGYEVAERLHLPLEVYVVRKLGVPGHAELAMGALAGDGTCVVDEKLVHSLRLDDETLEEVIRREAEEIRRREETYRDRQPQADVAGKTVILVDDGVATGATMRVAATALRRRNPAEIVVAVPVAAYQTCVALREVADRVVCPFTPGPFVAVGLYYEDFDQTSDDEVRRLLAAAAERTGRRKSA